MIYPQLRYNEIPEDSVYRPEKSVSATGLNETTGHSFTRPSTQPFFAHDEDEYFFFEIQEHQTNSMIQP